MAKKIVALLATIFFLLLLVLAISHTEIGFLSKRVIQIDSKLFYVIAFSVALGAVLMFLFTALIPVAKQQISRVVFPYAPRASSTIREAEVAMETKEYEKAREILMQIPHGSSDYALALKLQGDLA